MLARLVPEQTETARRLRLAFFGQDLEGTLYFGFRRRHGLGFHLGLGSHLCFRLLLLVPEQTEAARPLGLDLVGNGLGFRLHRGKRGSAFGLGFCLGLRPRQALELDLGFRPLLLVPEQTEAARRLWLRFFGHNLEGTLRLCFRPRNGLGLQLGFQLGFRPLFLVPEQTEAARPLGLDLVGNGLGFRLHRGKRGSAVGLGFCLSLHLDLGIRLLYLAPEQSEAARRLGLGRGRGERGDALRLGRRLGGRYRCLSLRDQVRSTAGLGRGGYEALRPGPQYLCDTLAYLLVVLGHARRLVGDKRPFDLRFLPLGMPDQRLDLVDCDGRDARGLRGVARLLSHERRSRRGESLHAAVLARDRELD